MKLLETYQLECASGIQYLQGLGCIRDAHDHQAFLRICRSGAVAVFNIDPAVCEFVGEAGEFARFVAAIDHEDVIFNDERTAFFEDVECFAIIADDYSNNAVVHRVASRNCVDIDFGFGEGVSEAREHTRAIIQEEG